MLSSVLSSMKLSSELADTTVILDTGESLQLHSLVLAAASEYFSSMAKVGKMKLDIFVYVNL